MIRREVIISPEAETDLLAIYDWVAEQGSPKTALSYIARIEAHLLRFDIASERGSRHDDIRPELRTVGFERSLTIAFTVDEQRITILRIFRRGRNWTRGHF